MSVEEFFIGEIVNTLIYEYGCRLDKDSLAETESQFNKARWLYNQIIEIITKARNEADQYIRSNDSIVSAKLDDMESINAEFAAAKALNAEPAMADIAKRRRVAWRELVPLMKVARKAHREKLTEIFSCIGLRKECATYQARCAAVSEGLGSTTADDIHATALRAWDKVRKDGGKLRFRSARERTQDHIINRFTSRGGIAMHDLLDSPNTLVSLTKPNDIGDNRYGEFQFRLGSAKANQYAIGTWQYHRAFPAGSRVTTIRLLRRRIATTVRWSLQFQLAVSEIDGIKPAENQRTLLALHLGFSLADNGQVRIAAQNDAGDIAFSRTVDMPDDMTSDLFTVEKIRSRRDTNRDNIMAAILSRSPDLPEELAEDLKKLKSLPAQHVHPQRIKWLSRGLEQSGDTSEFATLLKQYTIQDYWLELQERHLHKKVLNRRKNHYREICKHWARNYKIIVLSRYDLKEMALRIDEDGERNELGQIARRARHLSAHYQLIDVLQWAATRSGSVVIEDKDCAYANTCSGCCTPFVHDSDIMACECGIDGDQKANAAASLFQKWNDIADEKAAEIKAELTAKAEAESERKRLRLLRLQDGRKTARNSPDAYERSCDT